MEFIKRVARNYWVAYYLVYVAGVAVGLWRYWPRLLRDDGILWLAVIFAVSAGIALLAAIFLEVLGRMVLLIPAAIKKIKEQGIKEERKRAVEALAKAGVRSAASGEALTPAEIQNILQDGSDDRT